MPFRRFIVVAVSVLGLAVLAIYAWQANRGAPATTPGRATVDSTAAAAPIEVEVAPVLMQAVADDVSAVGTLVSNESVILRPEIAGRVAAIHFRDGAPVKKGAVLVELDAAVQRAELQQARANLALAQSNARRAEDLFARRFVSQSGRDEAASQLEVARATVALADARYERTRIRAPFDGVVGIRNVSVGDFIKDGEVLVNVEDIATLKLDFRLPELYVGRLRQGLELEVTSDVLPGEVFRANVDAIDPLVDAQGRAVLLRARLSNADGRLRPGMFARVRLILRERPDVLLVPEEALVPAPGNIQFVYRVVGERAARVDVTTGVRRAGMVEIVSGLSAGARVVTAGQLKLRDGDTVRVVPPAFAAGAGKPG